MKKEQTKKNKSARRSRNLYDPDSAESFNLSRSSLESFLDCPKCFYIDRRLGISQPGGMTLSLNNAVDALLKKEFDIHRAKGEAHPLMKSYSINAVPFQHQDIEIWRNNRKGVQFLHESTNFLITGAIDDVWVNSEGKLIVVDYKATSTKEKISLDDKYKQAYKRQVEIYQWLLKKNGFEVSDDTYFVFVNGKTDREAFDRKLEFDVEVIHYRADSSWVENTIINAYKCLQSPDIPDGDPECEYCNYVDARNEEDRR